MKASELIEHLKEMIDKHGDHEVIAIEWDIENVALVEGAVFGEGIYGPNFQIMTDGEDIPSHAFTPEDQIPEWARGKVEAWKAQRA